MVRSKSKKVLFVLSSQEVSPIDGENAGWFLPEFVHPFVVLEDFAEIVVSSPSGGLAPLSPYSVQEFKDDPACAQFLKSRSDVWANTAKLSSFKGRAEEFDAIFYVGGQGPMFDIVNNPVSQTLIREFWEAGKIVSTVCHGSAALAHVKLSDGSYLIQGAQVTGFSDAEEQSLEAMPFSLEKILDERTGGGYQKAVIPGDAHVVIHGRIITGQNPASATPVGNAIRAAL